MEGVAAGRAPLGRSGFVVTKAHHFNVSTPGAATPFSSSPKTGRSTYLHLFKTAYYLYYFIYSLL